MIYQNKMLGEDLNKQLDQGFDVVKISRWAYKLFSHNHLINPSTEEILEYLFRMEDDPQFEFNQKELRFLAKLLINGEENPIKIINKMKSSSN